MKGSLSWSEVINSILFKKKKEKKRKEKAKNQKTEKEKRSSHFTLHTNSDTIAAKTKKIKK